MRTIEDETHTRLFGRPDSGGITQARRDVRRRPARETSASGQAAVTSAGSR